MVDMLSAKLELKFDVILQSCKIHLWKKNSQFMLKKLILKILIEGRVEQFFKKVKQAGCSEISASRVDTFLKSLA